MVNVLNEFVKLESELKLVVEKGGIMILCVFSIQIVNNDLKRNGYGECFEWILESDWFKMLKF